jgi:lysozyme
MIKLRDILIEDAVNMKDGTTLRASQRFWDEIKRDEGLPGTNGKPALKAYKLGDGRITIGWGHTGSMSGPTPKLGDKIDQATAQKYLQADANKSAECVRRILNKWKQENNRAHEVTQSMFDALVSIVFNAGCDGLRESEFIQLVKTRDWKDAAMMLPSDSSMIRGKFTKGLVARRKRESARFLEDGVPLSKYFGKGERLLNMRSSKR